MYQATRSRDETGSEAILTALKMPVAHLRNRLSARTYLTMSEEQPVRLLVVNQRVEGRHRFNMNVLERVSQRVRKVAALRVRPNC